MSGRRKLGWAAGAAAIGAAAFVGARVWRRRGTGNDAELRSNVRGITIRRPRTQVYEFWRDLTGLVVVNDRIAGIEAVDEQTSRWVVRGPLGSDVEFMARVVVDEPGRVLAWRAEDSPVPHEGRVEFSDAPDGHGTEVRIGLSYQPPAGRLGVAVTKLTGDEPDMLVRDGLRRVKQALETGEVLRVHGQPTGRGPLQEKVTRLLVNRVATGGRP